MGQPDVPTQTEVALEEFRKAGAPIVKAPRLYRSKRMEGFNAEVYSGWIERWAVNAATNFPVARACEGVGFLRNAAKDVPAVVIGIGPSLDDEIAALKTAQRHAVLIATDAAVRPLLRHGIRPDLVLNFDARDEQRTMWDTIDTSGLVLLANTVTSPLTLQAWGGKLMVFNMLQSDDEFSVNILPCLYPFAGQLPNQGTVGNGAVFLAYQMGCKPIMGVGMDLCYRLETIPKGQGSHDTTLGASYKYRCTDWHKVEPTVEFPTLDWKEVENKVLYDNAKRMEGTTDEMIKGKSYRTDECLRFYRNALVSSIGQFDMDFINCSGGVLTDLVRSMPLKQALEEKCYAALEPGRTVGKHLAALIEDGRKGWELRMPERVFVPATKERTW